jgi:hypothetical protein
MGTDSGFHIFKVPVFALMTCMNARELWLYQAAQVVVERSHDGKVPGPPSTATKLAFTCKFI